MKPEALTLLFCLSYLGTYWFGFSFGFMFGAQSNSKVIAPILSLLSFAGHIVAVIYLLNAAAKAFGFIQ